MNEIERVLKGQKVAVTSDEFDGRMNGLFEKLPERRPFLLRRSVAPWQAMAAALVMGGMGFWIGQSPMARSSWETVPETVTTTYVIEARTDKIGNMFETLPAVEPFYRPPAPPISVVQTILHDSPIDERSI